MNAINNNSTEDTRDISEASDEEIEIIPEDEKERSSAERKLKTSKDALSVCIEERKRYLEGWQRAQADLVNYKKEEARRFEDLARFVARGIIQELLTVLDSFYLAVHHGLSKEVEQGVLLIRSQLEDVLKRRGCEAIAVRAGDRFDPALHESIGEVAGEGPPGTIAEEVQRGYRLQGQVLRPTRVRIVKEMKD